MEAAIGALISFALAMLSKAQEMKEAATRTGELDAEGEARLDAKLKDGFAQWDAMRAKPPGA